MNAILPNTYDADGSDAKFTGHFTSNAWVNTATGVGTWIVRVKGTTGSAQSGGPGSLQPSGRGSNGLFNSIYSNNFTLKIVDPCISAEVDDIVFTDPNDPAYVPATPELLEARVNAGESAVLRTYTDPDIRSDYFADATSGVKGTS